MDEIDARLDELEDRINDLYIQIRERMNEKLFPRGREEVSDRLDALIYAMTFIGIDHEPVDWWKTGG